MKKNISTLAMSMVLVAALFTTTACAQTTAESNTVATVTESPAVSENTTAMPPEGEEQGNMVMAKITAIEGSTITVQCAEMPEQGAEPNGEVPSGEVPSGEAPSGEAPSGEAPSGEKPSGEPPSGEKPSGEMPQGGGNRMTQEFTGETKTITIDDSVVIKESAGRPNEQGENTATEEATLTIADLAVDDVVSILYDGDTVKEISVRSQDGNLETPPEQVSK